MKSIEYKISDLIDFFILTDNRTGLAFFGKIKETNPEVHTVTYGALEKIFSESYVREISANVTGHWDPK